MNYELNARNILPQFDVNVKLNIEMHNKDIC